MSLEAVVGVASAETIVEALLVGYTQLQTERNLRVREWPLIFASDLDFLRLVEPEWIERARAWDFLFFWFSRMFYRHANRYQEKLHVISANIHAIWNLRQAMNLDALLNRRPQRRPDLVPAVRLISPEEPTSSAPCVSQPSPAHSHATVQHVGAALRPLNSAVVWTTSTTRPSMLPGTRAPNPRWTN
jgi:hypothetical protein